ncbi:MAG TPA: DUF5667 domain-containing protein [Candidatus Paceibacterota bacterium]
MIDNKFHNLIEDLKSVKMTREEKSDVLSRVFETVEKMESNFVFESKADLIPSPISATEVIAKKVKSNLYPVWYQYIAQKKFIPSVAMLFVLIATGGVSLAAEGALPGDTLYSLKVNVNESVKSFVAITPEAKAKFAVEATDRRLKEAAVLSQNGRLNIQTSEIIKRQLSRQADQVKFQVASLVSTNNLRAAQEVAVNFESSLRTHELILEKISDDQASSSSAHIAQIDNLIFALKTEIATTTFARNDLQAKEVVLAANSDSKAKIELRLGEVKTKLADIKALVGSSSISASTASTSRLYLAEATRLVSFASDKLAKSFYPEALTLTQSAFQYATDAEILIATDLTVDGSLKSATARAAISAASFGITPLSTSSSELILSVSAAAASSTASSTASTTPDMASSTASTTPASSGTATSSVPAN